MISELFTNHYKYFKYFWAIGTRHTDKKQQAVVCNVIYLRPGPSMLVPSGKIDVTSGDNINDPLSLFLFSCMSVLSLPEVVDRGEHTLSVLRVFG